MRQNSAKSKSGLLTESGNATVTPTAQQATATSTAGRLFDRSAAASNSTAPPQQQPKKTPSSKRSASSLASSLISSLSASTSGRNSSGSSSSSAATSATLPAINKTLRSYSGNNFSNQAAAAAAVGLNGSSSSGSSSRTHVATLKSLSHSSSPANTAGSLAAHNSGVPRAQSGGSISWASAASGLVRDGSLGSSTSESLNPTPSARSFTDSGASISPLSQGQKGRVSVRQLPALPEFSGGAPCSADGVRNVVVFKEAAVKFLDLMGIPLGSSTTSSSSGTGGLLLTGERTNSSGGYPAAATAEADGNPQGAGGKRHPARRQSKVSFHPATKVAFFDSSAAEDADSNNSSVASISVGCVPCLDASQQAVPSQHSAASSAGVQQLEACSQDGTSCLATLDSDGVSPKGFGFAVLKKLALVLDGNSSSTTNHASTSGDAEAPSSSESASISVSPIPTPKDGNSAAKAAAYKQHHGYLPTPTASSAGQQQKRWSSKSGAAGSTLSRAGSTKATQQAAADETAMPAAAAAGTTDTALPAPGGMSPLPPGAVPLFGAAAAAATAAAAVTGLHAVAATDTDISSSTAQPGMRTGACRTVDNSRHSAGSSAAVPSIATTPLKLGPASLPGPLLLAVSPNLPPALQRDWWCLSDFVVQKKLYDGFASTICKAKDRKTGTIVALKLYRMHKLNEISTHQVAREVRLQMGLQHENCIMLHAAWQEAGNVVLVQEFAGGGDLWSFIDANSGRLTERVTVSLVLQPFLRGLQYLHSAGIAHRDIKPENVLFSSDMVLKIADFGLSVNLREEPAVTRVGTLDYMSPEVLRCPLKRQPGDNKDRADLHYATAVDAWAVGVLAFELLTGRAPFSAAGASDINIQTAICTAAPVFPSRLSEPAKEFIAAALSKTASARPTVLHMLQHPWIRSFQRSCSTARAEPRTNQDLGGKGRLLCSPSMRADAASCTNSAGSQQQQQCAGVCEQLAAQQRPEPGYGQQDMQRQAPPCTRPAGGMSGNKMPAVHDRTKHPPVQSQVQVPLGRSGASSRDPGLAAADAFILHGNLAAAAASVWNSDDNGLTGYASLDCCL